MPERAEYYPQPATPDKSETPAAKNARLRPQREGGQEVDLTPKLNELAEVDIDEHQKVA